MPTRGICYDTGFVSSGTTTHEPFDPAVVAREMRIIREELHCDAVRITGGRLDRLLSTADAAAAAGLEVWLCPFVNDIDRAELLTMLDSCAEHAERLRANGSRIVVSTGSELAIMVPGFLPGTDFVDRAARLRDADPAARRALAELPAAIDAFLTEAVEVVRRRFAGPVTYCSLPLERVDWRRFDILATDAGYRDAGSAPTFVDTVRAFVAQGAGKPVAITEFGCATHRGAADAGSRGADVLRWDGPIPVGIDGELHRDETEQADYLRECLDVFDAEGVAASFVYAFSNRAMTHRTDGTADLDLASLGVVAMLDNGAVEAGVPPWRPKEAFRMLADRHRPERS